MHPDAENGDHRESGIYLPYLLLRLGLIGPEYKNVREHLLANLEGDRAWRYDRSTYECLNRNHRAEDAR